MNILHISVYHADGALKIAPACSKFRLLKAECLALLGRVEVGINFPVLFSEFSILAVVIGKMTKKKNTHTRHD